MEFSWQPRTRILLRNTSLFSPLCHRSLCNQHSTTLCASHTMVVMDVDDIEGDKVHAYAFMPEATQKPSVRKDPSKVVGKNISIERHNASVAAFSIFASPPRPGAAKVGLHEPPPVSNLENLEPFSVGLAKRRSTLAAFQHSASTRR